MAELGYVPAIAGLRGASALAAVADPGRRAPRRGSPRLAAARGPRPGAHAGAEELVAAGGARRGGDRQPAGRAPARQAELAAGAGLPAWSRSRRRPTRAGAERLARARRRRPGSASTAAFSTAPGCSPRLPAEGRLELELELALPARVVAAADGRRRRAHSISRRTWSTWRWCSRGGRARGCARRASRAGARRARARDRARAGADPLRHRPPPPRARRRPRRGRQRGSPRAAPAARWRCSPAACPGAPTRWSSSLRASCGAFARGGRAAADPGLLATRRRRRPGDGGDRRGAPGGARLRPAT